MQVACRIAAAWCLVGIAVAQEQAAKPAQTEPAQTKPAQTKPASTEFARITAAGVQPRCFATEHSPLFPDVLAEGQIVRVGPKEGEFRRVYLPGGVTGFAHKKFTSAPEKGEIHTTGTNVAFRYRPQSGEAPATMLPEGTALQFIGEKGDWWRVRSAAVPAFLAAGQVQVAKEPKTTLEASYAALTKRRQGEWTDAIARRERKRLAAAALQRRHEELVALAQKLAGSPPGKRSSSQLDALEKQVESLMEVFAKDEEELAAAKRVKAEIDKERLLVEAIEAVEQPPVTHDVAAEIATPAVPDPLARFTAVGWLRCKPGINGKPPRCVIEKGGRRLLRVFCPSMRYDLLEFDGLEVGLIGPVARIDPMQLRQLTLKRLEVLGKR